MREGGNERHRTCTLDPSEQTYSSYSWVSFQIATHRETYQCRQSLSVYNNVLIIP